MWQISDLEYIDAEAFEGMNVKDMEIKDVEELVGEDTKEYSAVHAVNSAMKTIHHSDHDVFQFILDGAWRTCVQFQGCPR